MRIPLDNFRSKGALIRFVLVCAVGLSADLWSKDFAFRQLKLSYPHSDSDPVAWQKDPRPTAHAFIPGWIHFDLMKNYGAVFGIGKGQTGLFLAVSVVAIGFLSYLFAISGKQRFYQVILGMLLAGVLGNMYDRIFEGYVRDMIHALPGWRWPGSWTIPLLNYPDPAREVFPFIFNIADVLLCVGVGLMIVHSLFFAPPESEGKDGGEKAGSAGDAPTRSTRS